ncbi:MAG: substrate-binding domain-containing protein [Bacillota bacterium]
MKRLRQTVALLALLTLLAGCGTAKSPSQAISKPANPHVILATTTSTQDSGLLDVLVPMFEKQTGYKVKTIAVGTGQALAMGEKGEADVLLVHAPASEKPLVEKGVAINRRLVMHNDFVLIGPAADPAKVKGIKQTAQALKRIAGAQAIFISRGDDSGTHKKELSLWKAAGIAKPEGSWYQETGQGMGQTIAVANEKNGYTLTDRATFLAQQKNIQLQVLLEGDAPLLNIYHVMEVNKAKFDKVNAEGGKAFADFLLSKEGQDAIQNFGVEKYGQPLFFADGGKAEADLTGGK